MTFPVDQIHNLTVGPPLPLSLSSVSQMQTLVTVLITYVMFAVILLRQPPLPFTMWL